MRNGLGSQIPISTKSSFLNNNLFPFNGQLTTTSLKIPPISSSSLILPTKYRKTGRQGRRRSHSFKPDTVLSNPRTNPPASSIGTAQVEEQVEVEVAEGFTITQFCDKMIDVFMNEKPQSKDWRKLLVFREEWNKYRECFYHQCRARSDSENDQVMKQKLIVLGRKVKKLLKEIQDSPTDINAVVARRRKDFTGEFFRHLTLLSETYDSLDDRDAMARLGAKCLSAVCAYDNTVENVVTLDAAQAKFDDILNSPSLDVACAKIKSLAKAKELDSSLVLLINSAWASAKESQTMKSEVKDIMYHLYKTTKSSLRSIAPKEIKLLKHLLNITDPEERFSALATAFSPGDEHEVKDPNSLYTTPKELHKWIKIMLDAYLLNKEDTDMKEAKQMTEPVVIQRLYILKETIEEEYLKQKTETEEDPKSEEL
ncbi:hypothetical protein HHK36_003868 [Tetracentron sinense]|uniref:Uncharacterized protein n=1 Tax=Tetracentron sinense TaxID=13715 RepID=A0A834ZYQ5_TETSI|nr:hypothetical protein HHK36_003868 [Tetracentron sinense]